MAPAILYTTCVLGAVGLYLIVAARADPDAGGGGRRQRVLGSLLGLGAFAYLVVGAAKSIGAPETVGSTAPQPFFVIFSLIALASAVRMITHHRPVYSALYFVLVVISSAGLFLLLEAEFLAFALIIVYAGAILITYMFVLMLAQQSPDPNDPGGQPEYDLNPREPAAGAVVGFILLALLSRMILDGTSGLPDPPADAVARTQAWEELRQMPARVEAFAAKRAGDGFSRLVWDADGPRLDVSPDGREARVTAVYADGSEVQVDLPMEAMPENVQRVGLALVGKFPVSLELAGVILLMAMFGAVILARRRIELTEDEKREAGGLRRLGHHDEPEAGSDLGDLSDRGNGGGG